MAFRRKQQPPSPPTRPGGPFHITRLDQGPPSPPEPAPAIAPANLFGVRFTHPASALTLLTAALDGSANRTVHTLRAPDDAVWILAEAMRPTDIELAWTLGGSVYLPDGLDLVSPGGRRYRWDDFKAWSSVSCIELASFFAPGDGAIEQHEILVVTTGSFAGWILDRFHASDLEIRVATAGLRSVFRTPTVEWPAVLVRVKGRGDRVPKVFVRALSGLPHTVVCRLGGGRLLVDQRLVLPLPDTELARGVPPEQEWLLAGELGVWQLTDRSAEYTPPLRVDASLQPPSVPANGHLPADLHVEVTLVTDERPHPVDALLLTDDDLVALRRILTVHPAAERAFLILGPGLHLFAEPARDVSDIPVGVPLHRIGPGALYQEVGYRLKPTLPGPARADLFKVDDATLVILSASGAHRLLLANAVPAWSLWLGPTVSPARVDEPLSDAAKTILESVDAADARMRLSDLPTTGSARPGNLRTEGFLLEQRGKLAEAAHKYWEAGEPALAARLYELAARALT